MKYCRKCLQPDTRPNIYFSKDGICPACIYHEELKNINWEERHATLKEIFKKNKKKKGTYHDCIMGVSGGKDSTRQALWIKEKFDINPLLVCQSYPPEQVTNIGVENLSNLINLGFDVHVVSLGPKTWKKLMKKAFIKFSNFSKSTELALFSAVPQLAIRYKIPLILWGENPALQLGDMKTLGKNGYDGNNLRNMNTLNGGELNWILENDINENEILGYKYPEKSEFDEANLQIIYLGWFLGDWSIINNALCSCSNGLLIREDLPQNTGDIYGVSALDEDWVIVNQMIKFYKYGFGKATDFVNEEIRNGIISRSEGIKIVNEYDGRCNNKYIDSFCKYIEISKEFFWKKVIESMDKDLFGVSDKGTIYKKFIVH